MKKDIFMPIEQHVDSVLTQFSTTPLVILPYPNAGESNAGPVLPSIDKVPDEL